MRIKRKLLFAVIIMVLLSTTALAVPVTNDKNVILVTNDQDKSAMKPLVADFDITASFSTVPPTIYFIDKSIGSPTCWSWSFGDESTSTAKNPVHKYSKAGKYTVTLTVNKYIYSDTVKKIIAFTGCEKDGS